MTQGKLSKADREAWREAKRQWLKLSPAERRDSPYTTADGRFWGDIKLGELEAIKIKGRMATVAS